MNALKPILKNCETCVYDNKIKQYGCNHCIHNYPKPLNDNWVIKPSIKKGDTK